MAQLRCILRPVYPDGRKSPTLAYVEYFQRGHNSTSTKGPKGHIPDLNINMYRVTRHLRDDGSRMGDIIELTDIWRPIQLVPRFGPVCPPEWNCDNAVELAKEFYVNQFWDKQIYCDVY